jgi:hypothetical protein
VPGAVPGTLPVLILLISAALQPAHIHVSFSTCWGFWHNCGLFFFFLIFLNALSLTAFTQHILFWFKLNLCLSPALFYDLSLEHLLHTHTKPHLIPDIAQVSQICISPVVLLNSRLN